MSTEVNTALGTWSELFMLLAALVYVCVFICFAWDMASHSKTLSEAEKRTAARSSSRSRELVGAGGGSSSASGAHDSQRDERNDSGAGQRAGSRRGASEKLEGQVADPRMGYGTSERRPAARAAIVLMVMAFAIHVVAVVTRSIAAQRVPWGNMYEFSTTSALIIAGIYLIMLIRRDLRFVGVMISGLVTLLLTMATIAHPTPVSPLQPVLQSYWLIIHVSIAVLATALFTLTAAMSILQLVQSNAQTRLMQGKGTWSFLRLVPTAGSLENWSYRINAVGFVMWSFTLIAGAIWAEAAWGRYWNWDTKEVWTFVIWVVYAAYLHARATRGWSGPPSAWLSIAGYLCIIFNFTVVNVYFSGLHSYSGL